MKQAELISQSSIPYAFGNRHTSIELHFGADSKCRGLHPHWSELGTLTRWQVRSLPVEGRVHPQGGNPQDPLARLPRHPPLLPTLLSECLSCRSCWHRQPCCGQHSLGDVIDAVGPIKLQGQSRSVSKSSTASWHVIHEVSCL